MPFSPKVKEEALVKSARRCCVCHVFAGLYAAVHHIVPEAENGPDTIDNAIVLCHRCHGEAGHYNPKHPIGNKYGRTELRKHRDAWWNNCERTTGFSFPEDPICVRPARIALLDSRGQVHGELVVSNRTNDPYWQVWLRLTFQPSIIDLAEMEIGITERCPQVARAQRAGDLSIEGLHVITHDLEGRQLRFFMIDRLRPGQYVSLMARLPIQSRTIEPLQLCIDLWSLGTTPLAIAFKDGKAHLGAGFPVSLHGESRIWVQASYPLRDI